MSESGRPRVVCWPRLSLGREATVAALQAIGGIDLVVAHSLDELLPLLATADALVLHSAPVDQARPVVEALMRPGVRLRWLHFLTAGRDGFEAAGLPRSFIVTHAPGASAPAVAEHAMALLLALCRRLPSALEAARERRWDRARFAESVSLEGKNVVVIGTGSIGTEIARRLHAFGATAIGVSRSGREVAGFDSVRRVGELHAVLDRCAAVIAAVPLNAETRHLLDAAAFAALPRGALVVNIARGAVVDQPALLAALASGHVGGAGLDVADPEPPGADDAIWDAPNLILSPHVAVEGSDATLRRLAEATADNVRRFARGEPLLHIAVR